MHNKHVIITFTQIQFTIVFATVYTIVRNCIATVANALAAKLAGLQRQPIELPVRWVFLRVPRTARGGPSSADFLLAVALRGPRRSPPILLSVGASRATKVSTLRRPSTPLSGCGRHMLQH
jgi:hypothetical protein